MGSSFLTENVIRWEMANGSRRSLDQLRENVQWLLMVASRYELRRVRQPVIREAIRREIGCINQAVRAYTTEIRSDGADKVQRLTDQYDSVISAGRNFCMLAIPHLLPSYDDRFSQQLLC